MDDRMHGFSQIDAHDGHFDAGAADGQPQDSHESAVSAFMAAVHTAQAAHSAVTAAAAAAAARNADPFYSSQAAASDPQKFNDLIQAFWIAQLEDVQKNDLDFKNLAFPLARIKKAMRTDEDVRSMMIGSDATIVLTKACEIFVLELSLRAWSLTDLNKRRTIQKGDVANALAQSDMFDFLIDVVPRDDAIRASSQSIS